MAVPDPLLTPRLRLMPLTAQDLPVFHALVTDPHIRRYLMDGQIFSGEWAAQQIADSTARFEDRGAGLWLVRSWAVESAAIGFCGFVALPGTGLHDELIYALRQEHTGRGLATEMAGAMIAHARRCRFPTIQASVDAVNAASVRVLEKLGLRRTGVREGAFGDLLIFTLPSDESA